ncbi:MAG: hypothetical protein ACFCUX_00605 [Candidatus Methylacidiphilales bacterium]
MIALPQELPMVIWRTHYAVPLSRGWLAESIDYSLRPHHLPEWHWTVDVVEAVCHYLREDYRSSSIPQSDLEDIVHRSVRALGYEDIAPLIHLTAPRVVIHLPEIASRSGIELAFFQELQSRLDEALHCVVRGIKIEGIRDSVKSLQGTRRWKQNCQRLSDEIVSFVRMNLQRWDQPMVELIIQ